MKCEKCHINQATVHMQQFINGNKTEIFLCKDCSLQHEMPISFDNIFNGMLESILSKQSESKKNISSGQKGVQCPSCKMTNEGFKSTVKLGCAECYKAFLPEVETILKNIQGSARHEGKFPRKSGASLLYKREVDKLRKMLASAVEHEDFEEAAALRDKIRAIEI
ncbi:MAG: UvrB/UvrC motif-containing protein [Defluviitaleaceae bacterium]|nr:UvrB/UvrC motif-containing protein [Defluviitaleaceae bacterium]